MSLTYGELKEKLNELDESQLQQPVKVNGEEKYFEIAHVEILEEDYINPSGDSMEKKSDYPDPEYDDEPIVAAKGSVFLAIAE